eukprot:CAMPEP_0168525970 /NCGR_PEP_ID=MMETSP0405-20121227/11655_1 /TAXON_ID=498012 /ORGANISM="Trichosphaerium sp, Strain Am-I-7 wt" /LENGTH=129 /DNA_ID=CAMNT_0008548655 /DNA_START=103 /DNA_END=488 /DNA_ORIENTATION=-
MESSTDKLQPRIIQHGIGKYKAGCKPTTPGQYTLVVRLFRKEVYRQVVEVIAAPHPPPSFPKAKCKLKGRALKVGKTDSTNFFFVTLLRENGEPLDVEANFLAFDITGVSPVKHSVFRESAGYYKIEYL